LIDQSKQRFRIGLGPRTSQPGTDSGRGSFSGGRGRWPNKGLIESNLLFYSFVMYTEGIHRFAHLQIEIQSCGKSTIQYNTIPLFDTTENRAIKFKMLCVKVDCTESDPIQSNPIQSVFQSFIQPFIHV